MAGTTGTDVSDADPSLLASTAPTTDETPASDADTEATGPYKYDNSTWRVQYVDIDTGDLITVNIIMDAQRPHEPGEPYRRYLPVTAKKTLVTPKEYGGVHYTLVGDTEQQIDLSVTDSTDFYYRRDADQPQPDPAAPTTDSAAPEAGTSTAPTPDETPVAGADTDATGPYKYDNSTWRVQYVDIDTGDLITVNIIMDAQRPHEPGEPYRRYLPVTAKKTLVTPKEYGGVHYTLVGDTEQQIDLSMTDSATFYYRRDADQPQPDPAAPTTDSAAPEVGTSTAPTPDETPASDADTDATGPYKYDNSTWRVQYVDIDTGDLITVNIIMDAQRPHEPGEPYRRYLPVTAKKTLVTPKEYGGIHYTLVGDTEQQIDLSVTDSATFYYRRDVDQPQPDPAAPTADSAAPEAGTSASPAPTTDPAIPAVATPGATAPLSEAPTVTPAPAGDTATESMAGVATLTASKVGVDPGLKRRLTGAASSAAVARPVQSPTPVASGPVASRAVPTAAPLATQATQPAARTLPATGDDRGAEVAITGGIIVTALIGLLGQAPRRRELV
ncbi:hypothetical protein [Lacticaseibacillus absianus]|uniref:hypothetical protein n=1 Tax=Lacticaseibacillus absianus TaxID=2729623 RepID=UPI0015CE42A5|nr:hypothetical protein [Lacticaseibacillus absianus]